jgi:hypothetical protein
MCNINLGSDIVSVSIVFVFLWLGVIEQDIGTCCLADSNTLKIKPAAGASPINPRNRKINRILKHISHFI